MLLVLDVGNTNTTVGLFEGAALSHGWRLTSDRQRTVDEYGIMCRTLLGLAGVDPGRVNGIAIASVVPSLDVTLQKMAQSYFGTEPVFVTAQNCGMPILYDDPREVGADRLVNAIAAFAKYGGPCIVVDFGTATTLDVVSKAGEYVGGIICPGISISAEALFQRAALLRRIDLRKPERLIGTNPRASIQSGLYYGNIAMAQGLIERVLAEIGSGAHVISTGGLAPLISSETKHIEAVDPDLTLEGLRIVFERVGAAQRSG